MASNSGSLHVAAPNLEPEELQQYQASIQRLINCLSDPDRTTRRQALQNLHKKLTVGDQATPKPSPTLLQAVITKALLSPLVTLLQDSTEKCRSLSIELLQSTIPRFPNASLVMPLLVPAVAARVGRIPVAEPSEEVRLQLVDLALALIPLIPPQTIPALLDDLIGILQRGLEDSFHDIKKSACSCITALCTHAPPGSGQQIAPKLIPSLMVNLTHQHSKVRLSCVHALDSVVLAGLPAGLLETTIAPGIKALASDRASNVRESLFLSIACWMGHPKSPSHPPPPTLPTTSTYAAALLPILLLGITDSQDTIASTTLALIESIGQVYLDQNPSLQPATPMQTTASPDPAPPTPAPAHITYPKPFTTRPSTGAHLLISKHLPALLPSVLRDLREWTVSLRSQAARSLCTALIFSEEEATPHLPQLLPAFCAAVADEDQEVASHTVSSVHVVGACVEPRRWLHLALDQACRAPKAAAGQRASALVVLSALLYAAGTARHPLDAALLHDLATGLTSEDLQSAADHLAVRAQLLAVILNTLRLCDPATHPSPPPLSDVTQPLLWVLLNLLGHEIPDDPSTPATPSSAQSFSALSQLATRCGLPSPQHLVAQHAAALLPQVTSDHTQWGATSPSYLVFRALLLTCEAGTLAQLLPSVTAVMKPVLEDNERDPNLRLSMLRLVDLLLETPTTSSALSRDNAKLTLSELLLPALVWRAGKTAAAVRYAAITTLATMLRNRLVPPPALGQLIGDGSLLPLLFQSLDEDWYVDVRSASCYVMEQLLRAAGPALSSEQVRSVYIELNKRLDDSNNGVRVAACGALRALCQALTPEYCDTNSGYLVQGVVVHMDDSDKAVQEAACSVLEALAAVKPGPTATEVEKVKDRFRSKHYCERVLAACAKAPQ